MIRYSLVAWEFNKGAWAQAIGNAVDAIGDRALSEMMECSVTTVKNWRMMYKSSYGEFPHPSMHNFLKFCNMFDLDVREFWILEDA